jgi:hypothetical protein
MYGALNERILRLYYAQTNMKDTTISLKIDRALKSKIVSLAKSENRSLSNYIEKILKEDIAKHESKHAR